MCRQLHRPSAYPTLGTAPSHLGYTPDPRLLFLHLFSSSAARAGHGLGAIMGSRREVRRADGSPELGTAPLLAADALSCPLWFHH